MSRPKLRKRFNYLDYSKFGLVNGFLSQAFFQLSGR